MAPTEVEAYRTVMVDPDTLTFDQAMKDAENMSKWWECMEAEIQQLSTKNTWLEVPLSQAKTKVLPGTWVLRRKRNPDGEISKYKGRYCVRGDPGH